MSMILEIRRRSEHGIFAVPYRDGRRGKARRLPDGAIVETALSGQRREAPEYLVEFFGLAAGGVPATVHHANLGLVTGYLPLAGVYFLPDGDVAAIYGAEVVPIGFEAAPAA
jgi:hypothetical protein